MPAGGLQVVPDPLVDGRGPGEEAGLDECAVVRGFPLSARLESRDDGGDVVPAARLVRLGDQFPAGRFRLGFRPPEWFAILVLMWIPGLVSVLFRVLFREGFGDVGWRVGKIRFWMWAYVAPLALAARFSRRICADWLASSA